MNKTDIIKLWKQVGWSSCRDYHHTLNDVQQAEDISNIIGDNLHPSNINIKEFWKAAEEVFLTDPVANSTERNSSLSRQQANYHNHLIPLFLGLYGGVEFAVFNSTHKFGAASIAEIGCGYGSFYEHYIKDHKDIHLYTGFDIIKRTQNVIEIEGEDGTFSKAQIKTYKDTFSIFYSCNVFQHLTEMQITKYLTQVHEMLPHGGFFVFSYVVPPEKGYTYHYGQKIEIMKTEQLEQVITEMGYKIWFNYKQNENSSFDKLIPTGIVIEKL